MRLAGPLVQGHAATEREVAFVSVSRAYLLPTEAPVVPGDELLTGSARGATHRAAIVLFPRDSCKTFAIVVRSRALRSVVSLRSTLATDCSVKWVASMGAAFAERRRGTERARRWEPHAARPWRRRA